MTIKLDNKDYIWSLLGVLVSIGSSVIIMPFVLYYLSGEMYGLWSVFQSIAAITVLFDFGFSTTFARNINYCWCGAVELKSVGVMFSNSGKPNYKLMKKTMRACQMVFLLISVIALLCMLGPGTIYIKHISYNIEGSQVLIAWGIYIASIFLNLYYGYFNSFLRGVGAIAWANRVTVISRSVQIVLTIVFLICGFGLIGTGIAYLAYGFTLRILSKFAFMKFHGIGDMLRKEGDKISFNEVKELFLIVWHNARLEGLVTLANYLANQACTIISPLFLSLEMTGIYSLAVQLATVLSNVSGVLYTANQPVLQSACISNDRDITRRTMSLIVISYVILYIAGLSSIVIVGLPLLGMIRSSIPSTSIMICIGLYQFFLKFRNCYTSYFSCTNRILYARAFILSAVLCVIFAVSFLYAGFGIWGLIFAQIISQSIYNFWYWPLKAHREMELSAKEMSILGYMELKKVLRGFEKRKDNIRDDYTK